MTTQDIFGVEPGSEDYSHEVVITPKGKQSIGLKLLNGVSSVRILPPPRQPPPITLEQNSWHNGRGAEVWTPNAYNFYDSLNAWTSTPNKLHPTLLMQWATGFRDAEMNMPANGDTHKWVPLYPGAGSDPNRRYLSVSFTASVSSNRQRDFFIIRKRGNPTADLTMELCSDSGGSPDSILKSVAKTAASFNDVISFYAEFIFSSVQAVTATTAYHLKLYGGIQDTADNCYEVLCDAAAAGKNSANNASWSATTYSPYYRITDADINQRIFPFPFDGAWYAVTSRVDRAASKLYINGTRGKATSGTATTLTDTGAGQYGGTWTTNMWANYQIRIVRGTGQGQVRTISSNTATAITVSVDFDINPDSTSEYYIYGGPAWKEITGHGLGWVSSKPAYANGILYFPQNDTVDIRILQLNYANANDHGFDAEDTNHNRAWFLVEGYDGALGPVMLRANQAATATGVPNGKAISVAKAPTSPSGTPVSFGTDLTFQTSILVGDNTFRITGLYNHNNQIYIAKEDILFSLSGNVPVGVKYGADASPNIQNGAAACTGMDGQFYIAAMHDVFMIAGAAAYPLNLPFNLPSSRSGYVMDMCSRQGWLFAAVDAGRNGWSSIMRLSLRDRTWHEQARSWRAGRRIRSVAWQSDIDARPQLLFEVGGELMYQEFPQYGVRPIHDTGIAYQHEAVIEFPTMDLLNTDPKYFSYFLLNSQKLASATTASAYGRVALDYQINDSVGGTAWVNGGSFGISPQDKIRLDLGSKVKIRPRLRIESTAANNPPIVENLSLSLFSRKKQTSAIMLDINATGEDDVSGEDIWHEVIAAILTADTVEVRSIFSFLNNQVMVLPAEPNTNITNIDPEQGFQGIFQLYMEFLPL